MSAHSSLWAGASFALIRGAFHTRSTRPFSAARQSRAPGSCWVCGGFVLVPGVLRTPPSRFSPAAGRCRPLFLHVRHLTESLLTCSHLLRACAVPFAHFAAFVTRQDASNDFRHTPCTPLRSLADTPDRRRSINAAYFMSQASGLDASRTLSA